jgi:methyl-accepting chemotaxis protein
MTERNAQDSQLAAQKMSSAASEIADANARLDELVLAMNEINSSSGKVSKIIKTIDEIAFQSNILALNAAVEAARAGEAGMGFAVVADEVRNLAQRSAQAAHNTTSLIDDSIAKTRDGKHKLDQVADSIRSITGSAREARQLVDQIRGASEEQARGIQQVSTTLAQMQRITEQTAAGAEQSASAGEELFSQSSTLRAMVSRMASMVHGTSHLG